ncbi:uncharacterized protein LOC120332133 [Styela clava]|uniref:uncharacterized protein LOC120332133 n=1 Tax=Styela clava TaxID=7725 RepID=UPI0019399F04|nr:uncharacterized protein LOC120332133 [Styela clava]
MKSILFKCVIFAAFYTQGCTITCYDCVDCAFVNNSTTVASSEDDPSIPDKRLVDACFTFNGRVSGVRTIIRGYGWSLGEFCIEQNQQGAVGEFCYCYKDFCNEASKLSYHIEAMILTSAVIWKIVA